MKKFGQHRVGVDQGSLMMFSDFADDGPMWAGSGPRESRQNVVFSEPYKEMPAVTVTISMWDMDQKTNMRADISAEKVTRKGFQAVFRTWGDTRVARIRVDWMAIGPVADEDLWDLE